MSVLKVNSFPMEWRHYSHGDLPASGIRMRKMVRQTSSLSPRLRPNIIFTIVLSCITWKKNAVLSNATLLCPQCNPIVQILAHIFVKCNGLTYSWPWVQHKLLYVSQKINSLSLEAMYLIYKVWRKRQVHLLLNSWVYATPIKVFVFTNHYFILKASSIPY